MDILQHYIKQQTYHSYKSLDRPKKRSSIFVVIPCYNEPDILTTLNSLLLCYPPEKEVSVLIVINSSVDAPKEAILQNISTSDCIGSWINEHPLSFFDVQRILAPDLPKKWAGVGWARKIGMDEAVRELVENDFSDGIIV